MKKMICAAAVAMMAAMSASARTDGPNNKTDHETRKEAREERRAQRRDLWAHSVNEQTEIRFYNDFPDAKDVYWVEDKFAEASFLDGNVRTVAYYDNDNTLVGTTCEVNYAALPEKARAFIEKKYPGYTVDRVVLFKDNPANETDMFLFDASFEDQDLYFPELSNGTDRLILQVTPLGYVSYFQKLK